MELSRVVHLIRLMKDISLETLADKLNVTKGYIGLVESGKKSPGLHFLRDLSVATGVPFTYIGMLMDFERLEKDDPALLDAAIKTNPLFAQIVARKRLEDVGLIEQQKRITNIQNIIIPRLEKAHG